MDERKQQVLRAIVTLYTHDGEPIGSHLLSEHMDLAVSTCTMDGAPEESEDAWAETAIAVMAENGIADVYDLYSDFVGRFAQLVMDEGRTPIVWEGFPK